MKPLQLAPTIRTARIDEVPQNSESIKEINNRQAAKIVEGYTLQYNTSNGYPFKFYAEVNIDNKNLWALFITCLLQFPNEISFIYGDADDDPSYSPYTDKYELLNKIEPYKTELSQDGFLEFGIIYQDEKFMEEVFIKKAKYIQYWGMDEKRFKNIMNEYGIYEIKGLNFIDEYPLATEALKIHNPDTIETPELLQKFKKIFKINDSQT